MAAEEYIRIKPNPLINLTITSGNNTLVVSNMSTYYRLGLYYNETYPIVISADGYNSVTISDWTDWSNHTVSEEGDRLLTLKPSHLYGWTDNNLGDITLYAWDAQYASSPSVLYTKDAVPTSSSKYYDVNGNEIELSSITYNSWVATNLMYGYSNNIAFDCDKAGIIK